MSGRSVWRPGAAASPAPVLLLLLSALAAVSGGEDCESKPGGCRCYYDALADGCPQSLGHDSKLALCTCDYRDNTWFSVLSNFNWAFKSTPAERGLLGQKFSVRLEGNGILSMDVGYTSRVQCGASLAQVYPGTMLEVSVDELHQLARNIFWGQVRQRLMDACIPARIALQLLCLHAALAVRDGEAARAYAGQVANIYQLVEACVPRQTPWSFPGLKEYLDVWKKVPPDASPFEVLELPQLSWWPEPGLMRAKTPEESDGHYWPCVPLKDRACFPAGQDNIYTSCELCCDPGKGPTGDPACFGGEWTFNRCCHTPGGSGRFY